MEYDHIVVCREGIKRGIYEKFSHMAKRDSVWLQAPQRSHPMLSADSLCECH